MVSLLLFTLLSSCGTINSARPLHSGAHQAGVSLGGPIMDLNGLPLILPNLTIEGRSGLRPLGNHSWDINYGLHVVPAMLGIAGLHLGSSLQLVEQKGDKPALSLATRLYNFTNYGDSRKEPGLRKWMLLNQVDLIISQGFGDYILFGGLSQYTDLRDPNWILTPFAGLDFNPGGGLWHYSLEIKWMAANRRQHDNLKWVGINKQGALAPILGLQYDL